MDATVVKDTNPFPVLIFSPGNGTNIEFYTSLASEIASHRYIVIGVNHPYDLPAVELARGRIEVRTADLLFVLDQVLKGEPRLWFDLDPGGAQFLKQVFVHAMDAHFE